MPLHRSVMRLKMPCIWVCFYFFVCGKYALGRCPGTPKNPFTLCAAACMGRHIRRGFFKPFSADWAHGIILPIKPCTFITAEFLISFIFYQSATYYTIFFQFEFPLLNNIQNFSCFNNYFSAIISALRIIACDKGNAITKISLFCRFNDFLNIFKANL